MIAAWLRGVAGLFRGPAIRIDDARPADSGRLAEIHRASFHRGWGATEFDGLLRDRAVVAQRLCRGRRLAGFALSRMAAGEAEILSVAIDPACRGHGYSTALLRSHLSHLAGRGVQTVFLEVEENNVPALRLYRRAGFAEVGRRDRYYQHPGGPALNALVMRRDLS